MIQVLQSAPCQRMPASQRWEEAVGLVEPNTFAGRREEIILICSAFELELKQERGTVSQQGHTSSAGLMEDMSTSRGLKSYQNYS